MEQSIPERFEQLVRKAPGHVAVRTLTCTLTYGELNRFANRVARAILAACGSGTHTVGLVLEKEAPLVGAILGALKAGQCCVPLDPGYPLERASRILDDAGAKVIVTDARNASLAARLATAEQRVLNLDALDAGLSEENTGLKHSPDTVAYLIYTSGATGEPKGVAQTHRNVLHNVMQHANSLRLSSADRLTLLAYCTTAQAMTDLYCALLTGAALYPFDIKQDGLNRLSRWMAEEAITVYHSSATVFRHLAATLAAGEAFPQLRIVKLGSEPVSKRDVELARARFSTRSTFVNALSSTEANTFCQILIDPASEVRGTIVPVGFPVVDTEVLLLGEEGHELGAGEVGEIAVRSAFLCPGYWRRPDLTAKVFLPEASGDAVRTYRTGDLGRRSNDGALAHLGRKDSQVKIRGYRIEPAEVELALLEVASIREAAVMARTDPRSQDKRLVAYVVSAQPSGLDAAHVRELLQRRLPDHMVPMDFVPVAELPRTANGKVDRRALELWGASSSTTELLPDAPRDPLELKLARMWEALLGVHPVGIRDNFFDLGGHSLLAVRMIDEVEREFGIRLPLATLFEGATVAHVARAILAAERQAFSPPLIAIQPKGSKPPFYFLHGDFNGGGFCCRQLARYLGQDQPFFVLSPHGLDGQAVPATIEAMAADRLTTLLVQQKTGPFLLGGYCNGGLVAFEMAQRMMRRGIQVERLILIDAAGTNARYRWMQCLTSGLSRLLRHAEPQRLDLFLRARAALVAFRRTGTSFRNATRQGVGATLSLCLRMSKTALTFLTGGPRGPTAPAMTHHDRLQALYHRAISAYVPRPYAGRLVILRSNAMDEKSPKDLAAGWGAVCDGVVVEKIPGDHMTCITEHIATLAERLAQYLPSAGQKGPDCPAERGRWRRISRCASFAMRGRKRR